MSIKYTIESIQNRVKDRNILLISTEFKGGRNKHDWQCLNCQTEWSATPYDIVNRNTGCIFCARSTRLTIEEMQSLAKKRNGECLSTIYTNSNG